MFPLFAIINLIIAIPLFVAAFKIYKNYKKTGNELVGALYKVTLCLAFRMLVGFAAVFSNNLLFLASMKHFSSFLMFLAMAYSLTIHFNLFFSRDVPKLLFWGIIFWGVGITAYSLFYLEPAIPHFYSNFVCYKILPAGSLMIQVLSKIFLLFYIVLTIYVYISGSLKMTEKKTKLRATIMGSATLLLAFRGVITKFLVLLIDYFWVNTLSIVLSTIVVALYIIAIFVIKPPERPKYVKKVY